MDSKHENTMQPSPRFQLKGFAFVIVFCTLFLVIIFYKESAIEVTLPKYSSYYIPTATTDEYLVFNENCVIPKIEAFNEDVKKYMKNPKYFKCSKHRLLTSITKSNDSVYLVVNEDVVQEYGSGIVSCCFSYIRRKNHTSEPDNKVSYSPCTEFEEKTLVNESMVLVKCKDTKTGKEIYKNAHAFAIPASPEEKLNSSSINGSATPVKILFVGIDSVSRLNLRRALPSTYRYLVQRQWIEYQGYNKIGDNTFPNLMAIFTGRNMSAAYDFCAPKTVGGMDKCDLIWREFNRAGFVTAYAEDMASISTFNYKKKGFAKPPMDFYYRPYVIAAEDISTVTKFGVLFCAGPETSGERIMNTAKDFAETFENSSTFGVFWMNSFSHNDNNNPAMMDIKVVDFFEHLERKRVLENTFVIFISDHGQRFGEYRYTHSGWYEERLPYLFFWVPEWFRIAHPHKYESLKSNFDKLTTPYDLHMTLQDLLRVRDENYTITNSSGCPHCQSLFEPVSDSRSCEEVAIVPHYCTCTHYSPINRDDPLTLDAAEIVLNELQTIVAKSSVAKLCATYHLMEVMSASVTKLKEYKVVSVRYLLLIVKTDPEAVFEATLSVTTTKKNVSEIKLAGDISRLDTYAPHSNCVEDYTLKKYCYCQE